MLDERRGNEKTQSFYTRRRGPKRGGGKRGRRRINGLGPPGRDAAVSAAGNAKRSTS